MKRSILFSLLVLTGGCAAAARPTHFPSQVYGGNVAATAGAGCDEALIEDGRPVLPAAAREIQNAVDVDEDRGALSELYPDADTRTDGFYPLPCDPSLGGELPLEALAEPTQEEKEALDFVADFERSPASAHLEATARLGSKKLPRPLRPLKRPNVGPCAM